MDAAKVELPLNRRFKRVEVAGAGGLIYEIAEAVVDGHDLAFNIGDGVDAILDVEWVAFDVASAWLDNL